MDGTRGGAVFDEARLEAVRAFAYGAGHEINNPLANIAARAQALLVDEVHPERRRKLATIVDQAFRARDMIGGLMVFARPPVPRPAAVAVHDVVRPAVDAARSVAESRGVRLEYSPPPTVVTVHVDAGQVGEALRALVHNALEAVDEGGRVVVEVSSAGPVVRVAVVPRGWMPMPSGGHLIRFTAAAMPVAASGWGFPRRCGSSRPTAAGWSWTRGLREAPVWRWSSRRRAAEMAGPAGRTDRPFPRACLRDGGRSRSPACRPFSPAVRPCRIGSAFSILRPTSKQRGDGSPAVNAAGMDA